MSNEQIDAIIDHEVALEDSYPRGEKPKFFGEIIEQDGSTHPWFGDKKTCLHLAIDKATSIIVGGWFDYRETLNGYYHIFYQTLTNYLLIIERVHSFFIYPLNLLHIFLHIFWTLNCYARSSVYVALY